MGKLKETKYGHLSLNMVQCIFEYWDYREFEIKEIKIK